MTVRGKSVRGLTAIALLAAGAWAWAGAAQKAKAGEKPATAHLRAYIEAFNAGSLDGMKAFFEEHFAASALKETPVAQRIVRYQNGRLQLKSFLVERTVAELDFQTALLVKTGGGQDVLLRATVEKTPPHKLLAIMIEAVEDPSEITVPEPKANEAEFVAAVRAYLEDRTRTDAFSGVVLVAKDARVVFHEAFGFADREAKVPNRKDTRFNLGSINKSFTRVAIYQLARKGRLSLDDKIARFLPDYPNADAAAKVTIRQLLNMTSGIGDFFGGRYGATPKDKIRGLRDYLPLFADLPLEFEPGTKNKYSNGGYIVLGLIIEKASGVDYYAYIRENVFKPCGMLASDWFARDAKVPNLAKGYTLEGEGTGPGRVLNHATLPGRGSSAGGGYSTAEDMLKYVLALKDKKILLPDTAAGLGIAGGAPGINSVVEWDARSGNIVIVMTNFDPPTAGQTMRQIASWLPQ
jgi:CubicO group peptidase (beta-lactamase class C family)